MPADKLICPKCGALMNHHANKVNRSGADSKDEFGGGSGVIEELHYCPNCGDTLAVTTDQVGFD